MKEERGTKRTRRSHSEEFRRRVIEEASAAGASVAGVALANGLNANLLRKWLKASGRTGVVPVVRAAPEQTVIPVTVIEKSSDAGGEVRLDIRRGGLNVQMAWPLSELAKLNAMLNELLR
jgi:transposase